MLGNVIHIVSNTSSSLAGGVKMVSLVGFVSSPAVAAAVDFAVLHSNHFQRHVGAVASAVPLSQLVPNLVVAVTVAVRWTTVPLRWWACVNKIDVTRGDGVGSNASLTIRTVKDVMHVSAFNVADAAPSHCHTESISRTPSAT